MGVLELYNQALEDTGARHGIVVVDLASRLPKRSDLYYDLFHHTDTGNEEIARIIAGAVRGTLEARFPKLTR